MSLLDDAFENFVILNKVTSSDGYGGIDTTWTEGAVIQGAIVYDGSTQMKIAQAMGVTSAYTLTVRKGIEFDYHDVIRRQSDGKVFRITSNSDELKTPKSAGLNMLQYSAEEWTLP